MGAEKYIDESWKEEVEREKVKGKEGDQPSSTKAASAYSKNEDHKETSSSSDAQTSQMENLPELNFVNYISSLALQAMIFLGEMPNPMTNQVEKNFPQAKFLIDTLLLLREKTKGNLTTEEQQTLDAYIYELELKYVESIDTGKEKNDRPQK